MRVIKPQNIYVACDGPIENNLEELDKVLKTRTVIDKEIDWNYKSLKKLLVILLFRHRRLRKVYEAYFPYMIN